MSDTPTSKNLDRRTPGVYITEEDAFGNSIVGVETAVPIFIGYTERASDPVTEKSQLNTPVRISSMTDFINYFGGAAPQTFTVSQQPAPPAPTKEVPHPPHPQPSFSAEATIDEKTALTPFMIAAEGNQYNLYWQMLLFFANGGENCFVVSAGEFKSDKTIQLGDVTNPADGGLLVGLTAAERAKGPTMIVIPEACQLNDANYGTLVEAMLLQASSLQDRVAILDLPGCMTADSIDDLTAAQTKFSKAIAPQIASSSYGTAYAPALNSSVVSKNDVLITALQSKDNDIINNILTTQAYMLFSPGPNLVSIQNAIAAAFPPPQPGGNTASSSGDAGDYPKEPGDENGKQKWDTTLTNLLTTSLPVFGQIISHVVEKLNVAPPSGAIAGVWSKSDEQHGVWNAPASIALASVESPLYVMSDGEQGGFNVPTNGQAINIIRTQPSRGNVVWGARTLDGNSQDYRYIQVRRTLIYVEQSIKLALQSYAFAANDATTWTNVTSSISSFLAGLWQQGGLMGNSSSEAFSVECGLGSTMTAQDVLDGYLNVAVTLQINNPAEFTQLTFTQKMEG